MLDGTSLGNLKNNRGSHLIDVYDKLMATLGGSMGHTYEPRLVADGAAYDSAYRRPFLLASDGNAYILFKKRLSELELD